jgi:hypothetical protein
MDEQGIRKRAGSPVRRSRLSAYAVALFAPALFAHGGEGIGFEFRTFRLSPDDLARIESAVAPAQADLNTARSNMVAAGKTGDRTAETALAARLTETQLLLQAEKLRLLGSLQPMQTNRFAVVPGAPFYCSFPIQGAPLTFTGRTGTRRSNTGEVVVKSIREDGPLSASAAYQLAYGTRFRQEVSSGGAFVNGAEHLYELSNLQTQRLWLVLEPRLTR